MKYDDAKLDRALAALQLEEPPPDLRARILLATVQRPVPIFQTWELWMLGAAFAMFTWVVVALVTSPHAGNEAIRSVLAVVVTAAMGVLNPTLAAWFGVGAIAALVFGFSESALAVLRREKP